VFGIYSSAFSQAALVAFFANLGDVGLNTALMVCMTPFSPHSLLFFTSSFYSFDWLLTMAVSWCDVQYYLKARFRFDKDQFADLMVIVGVAGTASQVSPPVYSTHFILYCNHYSVFLEIFCRILLIGIVKQTLQLLIMPLLVPAVGEERLLSLGLLFSCAHVRTLFILWHYTAAPV